MLLSFFATAAGVWRAERTCHVELDLSPNVLPIAGLVVFGR